jgi:hypothetical protein
MLLEPDRWSLAQSSAEVLTRPSASLRLLDRGQARVVGLASRHTEFDGHQPASLDGRGPCHAAASGPGVGNAAV